MGEHAMPNWSPMAAFCSSITPAVGHAGRTRSKTNSSALCSVDSQPRRCGILPTHCLGRSRRLCYASTHLGSQPPQLASDDVLDLPGLGPLCFGPYLTPKSTRRRADKPASEILDGYRSMMVGISYCYVWGGGEGTEAPDQRQSICHIC